MIWALKSTSWHCLYFRGLCECVCQQHGESAVPVHSCRRISHANHHPFLCSLFFTVGKSRGKDLSSIPGMLSDEGEEEMETADVSEGLCLNMLNHWMDHY